MSVRRLAYVDIGHRNKRGRLGDRGALRQDPQRGPLEEATLATLYGLALDAELRRLGWDVILGGAGDYEERWHQADELHADVYLQLHVNAGGGDRGEIFYDYRSTRGQRLAELVADRLGHVVRWPCRARACRPDTNGVPRDADYAEAFSTIAGVRAVALCVEPYFVDGPQFDAFHAHLDDIGRAIAQGLAAWGQS